MRSRSGVSNQHAVAINPLRSGSECRSSLSSSDGGLDMNCVRVMFIASVIVGAVISSAPTLIADPENAHVQHNLVVNRHDPTDPYSPLAASAV